MPEQRRPRFDPDERFALDADPEDVLRRLLNAEDPPSEDETADSEESH